MKALIRFFLFIILFSFGAFGQTKVAVLSNKSFLPDIEKLNSTFKDKNINFELVQEIDYQILSSCNIVWFNHFDESKLTLKQNAALTLYFKNGGGVIGDFDLQKVNPKWVWFGKMFGSPISVESIDTQKDLIALQRLGNVDVAPMWKMRLNEVAKIKPPKYLKPVLMDLEGNPLVWKGQSEFGNKVFYSSISFEASVFENKEFLDFFSGGILDVSGKLKSDFLEKDKLPDAKNFHLFILADSLNHTRQLEYINPNYCVILTESGEVFNYESKSKNLFKIGFFEGFNKALDLTADPEFDSNGYVYAHFKEEKSTVKRLKFINPSHCESDTFTIESSLPISNSFLVSYQNDSIGLPLYYNGKRFILKDKIQVESLSQDGDVISSEPFVLPFENEKVNAISKNEKGQILVLEDSKLTQIVYSQNGQLPLFSDFKLTLTNTKIPYKLVCESKTNQKANIDWEINGAKLKGDKISYLLKKNGKYLIRMKAQSISGEFEVVEKEVIVGK